VSAGYTVSFPDGHILVLAYMEKIQRWLIESQGMPTTQGAPPSTDLS